MKTGIYRLFLAFLLGMEVCQAGDPLGHGITNQTLKAGAAPGLSNVVAASNSRAVGENQESGLQPSSNTNVETLWIGDWVTDTNGVRTMLSCWDPEPGNMMVFVSCGSVITNVGNYYRNPKGKFAKCELRDASGTVIPPRKNQSMEADFPARVSARSMPKGWKGYLANHLAFRSNTPPAQLERFEVGKVYDIKTEGDYTLTICPVVYAMETNDHYLDLVRLECVTSKIHLKP